jgi:cyclopropane-fatty-acyl-phospholipid synthase
MAAEVLRAVVHVALNAGVYLAERGFVPDALVRLGIRVMLGESRRAMRARSLEEQQASLMHFVSDAHHRSVAEAPVDINAQHYEIDPAFFELVLGPHRKYSCCYFPHASTPLHEAEHRMLDLVMQRSLIRDGQTILDLGCGWGSFALYCASSLPNSVVHAVSNSAQQKRIIERDARERGLTNLNVFHADVTSWDPPTSYDRIVCCEMFEHMKNYRELLSRIQSWLMPNSRSKLFVHIFSHLRMPYHFHDDGGASGWMTRNFFSGGTMPSDTLIFYFLPGNMRIDHHWHVNGKHYYLTSKRWLHNLDREKRKVLPVLEGTYGKDEASKWFHRWRLFFLACQELWRTNKGSEWIVSHYRFERTD